MSCTYNASSLDVTCLDADLLRAELLELGADDCGFVEVDRPALAAEKESLATNFPQAKTLVSFVVRMNRTSIRTPARSVANTEFHHTGDVIGEISRKLAMRLEERGVAAFTPPMGFPMEMDKWPGRIWTIAHKPVAVAAGLGTMGIHRSVIHPKFGSFVLLGTVAIDAPVSRYDRPISFNPCFECKLCVAACPVGAIAPDGHFDFQACYNHNYREFMGGFVDWIENVADSKNARDYRHRVRDNETVSTWQSLSFGANYKAAYCLAVCPAGDDVIGPYKEDRRGHLKLVLKPLQDKPEPVYVMKGTDAEAHVAKRFPHKEIRHIGGSLRPATIDGFFDGLPLVFQRELSRAFRAVFQFDFGEQGSGTVTIEDGAHRVDGSTSCPSGAVSSARC